MRRRMTVIMIAGWIGMMSAYSEAATNFNGSTILGIDHKERTITFRTKEGDKWTLPVEDVELLKKEHIAQGDQVSIEIDPNDRITKVVKPNESSGNRPAEPREDASQ